jgi:hypothetical protein
VHSATSAFTMGLNDIDNRRDTVPDGERIIAPFTAGLS